MIFVECIFVENEPKESSSDLDYANVKTEPCKSEKVKTKKHAIKFCLFKLSLQKRKCYFSVNPPTKTTVKQANKNRPKVQTFFEIFFVFFTGVAFTTSFTMIATVSF